MAYQAYRKLIILFNILFILLCFSACGGGDLEVFMFSDIDECYNITEQVTENLLQFYDDPSKDSYSKGLIYNAFVGFSYTGDDFSFKLFAYEFLDSDVANRYFENVTGKKNELDANFSDISGVLGHRRIVVCKNRAYSIYSNNNDFESVSAILSNLFSEQLF